MIRLSMEILESLQSVPTAPFGESAVIGQVRAWSDRLGLVVGRDEFGNLLLRPAKAKRTAAPWFFAAHMDHPGFLAREQKGRRLRADFLGSVRDEYFKGSPRVAFSVRKGDCTSAPFAEGQSPIPPKSGTVPGWKTPGPVPVFAPVRAVLRSFQHAESGTHVECELELTKDAAVPFGTVGMWDLPAFRLAGRRIVSRACDDVAGVASVLAALGEVAGRKPSADVTGLLTIAEEAGLLGATAACREGTIPSGALVVAIETSAAQKAARLGDGVVVRVGDRAWTFDPSLTADITAAAARLAKSDPAFRYTRQLMPGGVCESTAYCLWGHRAAGLCVPLGNYHNQGPRGRVAAERIDRGDYESLVKLLVALAVDGCRPGDAGRNIQKRLTDRLAALKKLARS